MDRKPQPPQPDDRQQPQQRPPVPAAEAPLTRAELDAVAGGSTDPTEHEPFLPGTYSA